MYDNLTLLFGPGLPDTQDTVNIAFVAAPHLHSDSAVAVLSTERYVSENYPHLGEYDVYTATQDCSGIVYADFPGTTVGGLISQEGGFNYSYPFSLKANESLSLQALISPIRINGLHVTRADTWNPVVRGGTVWRSHVVEDKEVEGALDVGSASQPSWLIRSGLRPGDEVLLIYSVPELRYGSKTTYTGTVFPGSGTIHNTIVEQVQVVSPHQISFTENLTAITSITVNGVSVFSGSFDGTAESSYIKKVDHSLKNITIAGSLVPEDVVVLTYTAYTDFYNYSGFKDFNGTWYTLDCNPEYGHYINDPELGMNMAAGHLLNAVTIYAIPTAYAKVVANRDPDFPEFVEVTVNFDTAFNWSETHFIRHMVGLTEEGIAPRQQDGPSNTWGHAVFGRNYYDENVFLSDDVFSNKLPSMMPIGRAILTAPASVKSVSVADIRQRGGGVPEDFPFEAVNTNAEGLDTLRSYFDLGTWDGPAVLAGGCAEIRIDETVLDRFSKEQVYKYVESQMLPGVDFVISYVPAADL